MLIRRVVLLADNDIHFLNTRAEYLENAGFQVVRAISLEQARLSLQKAYIDLAILDIRMLNDDDPKDESGLELAGEAAFRSIPKIILTNDSRTQLVRQALRSAPDQSALAVDYVIKKDGPEAMISAVENAFNEHILIYPQLEISWSGLDGLCSFRQLAAWLALDLSADLEDRVAAELEDVFRKLLGQDCKAVRVGRLFWHKGQRAGLEVYGFRGNDLLQYLVVCGPRAELQAEVERYSDLAPHAFKTTHTRLVNWVEAAHVGAIAWELVGADMDALLPLAVSTQERSGARQAVRALAAEIIPLWHTCRPSDEPLQSPGWSGLAELLNAGRLAWPRVCALMTEAQERGILFGVECTVEGLTFQLAGGCKMGLPSLESWFDEDPADGDELQLSPGELDPETILVNSEGQCWLTDFAAAGLAPRWYDYARLEACLLFQLVPERDLLGAYEEMLRYTAAAPLDGPIDLDRVESGLRKMVTAIQEIRHAAAAAAGLDPLPYYLGLLAFCLQDLAAVDPACPHTPSEIRAGVLRSLLAVRLLSAISQIQEMEFSSQASLAALPPIRLSPDRDGVWVNDRFRPLTTSEMKLLEVFLDQPDRLVRKEDILRCFYPDAADASSSATLITSAVHRLRLALGNKRYIINRRGLGYKLVAPVMPSDPGKLA